jgi:AcrR family transcriptional regulator
MVKQADRRRVTREKILRAAQDLFDRQGYDRTTVDQIVIEADVAKGTFYQHFESKIEMLIALTRAEAARLAPLELRALEEGRPALEELRRLMAALCRWFETNRGVAEAVILYLFQHSPQPDSPPPQPSGRWFIETILTHAQRQGVVRGDASARELTQLWSAILVHTVVAWARSPEGESLGPRVDRRLTLFLEGVLTKKENHIPCAKASKSSDQRIVEE